MTKIAYVTTIAETQWAFLRGQNDYLRDRGFELHAIASPSPTLERLGARDGATVHPVPISRAITPLRDLVSLWQLVVILRRIRPDIAHLSTPKAALLGAIAARVARVPVRVFLVRGLITENARGPRRVLFRCLERLTARLCTEVVCVAPSLLDLARDEGIAGPGRGVVLGKGMSNGIDAERFDPGRVGPADVFPGDGPVVGFVGRLAADKGLAELYRAWTMIADEEPDARLLVVGPWEPENPVPRGVREGLESDPRVVLTGRRPDVAPYLRRMTMLVAPSHGTEGFPNALMEASAMALPVIASRVVGCTDAVVDGLTGMLVPPGDARELARAIRVYLDEPGLARAHGRAGRDRVMRDFRQEAVWEAVHRKYLDLLRLAGRPLPEGGAGPPAVAPRSVGESGRRSLAHAGKRAFDLAASAIGLVLLIPVLAAVALAIRLGMGGPVLFRQVRPGYRGRPFALVKFRTMSDARGADGHLLPDADRLTRLGRFLRRTSLDELPQLWNVLRGDLSLVGPRPLLMAYLPLYSPEQARRHDVPPGITGWAQVHGRNAIGWSEKFALDAWYVDHWSLALDLKILGMTVGKVLRREGVNAEGEATVAPFRGASPGAAS